EIAPSLQGGIYSAMPPDPGRENRGSEIAGAVRGPAAFMFTEKTFSSILLQRPSGRPIPGRDGFMPYQRYSTVLQKLELRSKALAANIEETPELVMPLATLDGFLALLRELTTEQARLTAARQEVSQRIAELIDKAQRLLTYVDLAVKDHYGNRS